MKKDIVFFKGFSLAVVLMLLVYYFSYQSNNSKEFTYVKLLNDCFIEDMGSLKKGTVLRVDRSMSEGFTRYILYLNLKSEDVQILKNMQPEIIKPYWLQLVDTVK